MKIIQAKYTNFKNIPNQTIELDGKSVLLIADNTLGKTNLMRGLRGLLGAKIGKNLIKEGEHKAEVEALLAEYGSDEVPIDGTEHTFKMTVKKNKAGDEEIALKVTLPNGEEKTTKTAIGQIVGEIELNEDFVSLSNSEPGKAKQLEIIKGYLDPEIIQQLDELKRQNEKHYKQRTGHGQERDRLAALIVSSGLKFSDWEVYKELKPIETLTTKISTASTHNTKRGNVVNVIQTNKEAINTSAEEVKELSRQIDAIREKIAAKAVKAKELIELNDKYEVWLKDSANEEIKVEQAQEELRLANEHNTMHKKVTDAGLWKAEYEKEVTHYENLTVVYETSIEAIKDAIRDVNLPVPGLRFDMEGRVFYNDKLVNENTLSTAEAMNLNIQLKFSKNPHAQVVFIDRGESLGLKYMQDLQAYANANGYQIIMEQVKRGQKSLQIEMMPDYSKM